MSASDSVIFVKASTSKENVHDKLDEEQVSKDLLGCTYDSSYGTTEYLASEFINNIVEKVAENQENLVSKRAVKPIFDKDFVIQNSENNSTSCNNSLERSPKFVLLNKESPQTSKKLPGNTKYLFKVNPLIKETLEVVQKESEVDFSLSNYSTDESLSFDSKEEIKPSKGTLKRFKAVLKELKSYGITKDQTITCSSVTKEINNSYTLTTEENVSHFDSIRSEEFISSLSYSDQSQLSSREKITSEKGFKIKVLHEDQNKQILLNSEDKCLPNSKNNNVRRKHSTVSVQKKKEK